MSEEVQITIIGGGVIGCAVAYELSKDSRWEDFVVIEKDPGYPDLINLVGIDSPGLTSSLAISKYVKGLLQETL